ncbi:hypothetical protein Esi_0211_0041 [Ectocarpus siliculosus]|uniref:Uncharacterized protein n=1 Tax=Ectocarpus siliculosus TaxID=2880 RepID=D7FR87_ECTSI|nr:hypothetical protein Esi_0211_0041 [Ectocarpus siliculosus]|eukprot:CBJ49212.1 hypothetical protein Esi_0211_0041 [Ectocarpus siliculosus]
MRCIVGHLHSTESCMFCHNVRFLHQDHVHCGAGSQCFGGTFSNTWGLLVNRNNWLTLSPKVLATTSTSIDTPPTPPLTRTPSVEHAGDGAGVLDRVVTVPLWRGDAVAEQNQEQQQPGETNWPKRLAATVMIAIRLFVRPNDVRARQESRDDENGHDHRHHEPRPSPWDRARASARKLLDRPGDTLRQAKNRFLGLFDNPIARTARLLELVKRLNFRDMPRQPGSRRQSSGDLFIADRCRRRTCSAIAASIKKICATLVAEFPQIGYNQLSR